MTKQVSEVRMKCVRTDKVLLFYSMNRYNPELKEVVGCVRDVLLKQQSKSGRYGRMIELPADVYEQVNIG